LAEMFGCHIEKIERSWDIKSVDNVTTGSAPEGSSEFWIQACCNH
jgi:hypothetical protein